MLMCLFFYIQKCFPTHGGVILDKKRPITIQISKFIGQIGDSFNGVMDNYFVEFKKKMRKRSRVPVSLVEKYNKDICFLVDIDFTYAQEDFPRVSWLMPLPYEVNINEAIAAITTLLADEIDSKTPYFGTYEEAKSKTTMGLMATTLERKRKKIVKNLEKYVEETENDAPLELTQGLGEDEQSDSSDSEVEEEEAQVENKKGKKQVIVEPPTKKRILKPKVSSTPVLRPRTRGVAAKTPKKSLASGK